MQYPYQDRNLFCEPENYFFADCMEANFFSSWKTYRSGVIERLKSIGCPDPADSSATALPVDYTKTGEFFARAHKIQNPQHLADRIEIFVVKYEVNKKLYAEYDMNNRRVKDSKLADTPDYIVFGECLAWISKETGSLKHLSTLLKLCDALCTVPISFPLIPRFIALIETESRLVENAYQ